MEGSYSRGQRALTRLVSRGITKCFSRAQKEKLGKSMAEIQAALQGVLDDVKVPSSLLSRATSSRPAAHAAPRPAAAAP